ncbi:MAG TPA: hypothetical protein VFH66_02725 [Mycobacteriales bacterium]|nr:hypothetical protein [Mycobacteriales bacterium]
MAREELTPVLVGTGLGFGAAAVLTPGLLARIYGFRADGETLGVLQLFGSRNFALGALALAAENDDQRDRVAKAVGIACAVDTVAAVVNGLRGRVSPRAAAFTAATTAGVAGLCAYYVSE